MSKGLDRIEGWQPVDLDKLTQSLPLRRLAPDERDDIEQGAVEAIRGAKTARAAGKALGKILNALAARYGA